jgi:hypothetical protein
MLGSTRLRRVSSNEAGSAPDFFPSGPGSRDDVNRKMCRGCLPTTGTRGAATAVYRPSSRFGRKVEIAGT